MALPKLLQKLFDDEGKGPKLKPSIIPTKINGQEPDETGEFNLQLSDPDAATRPEILTAVKKVTEASEVTFEPDESLPSVGHNIGEEWVSYTGVIPFGGIPYCGQEVTRETYRDLWEYAQTQGLVKTEAEWQQIATANNGNVPYYSSGDGSTTFRMPKIVGYVKGASSQSESGSYVAEGLPNITGYIDDVYTTGKLEESGALSAIQASSAGSLGSTGTHKWRLLTIDASKSSSIYGNSDHVTPETSVVLFGVYAFGEITNQGALDATTLATGLANVEANKLDKPVRYVTETWSSGASWYTKYNDGWIEQGGYISAGSSDVMTTINFNTPFVSPPLIVKKSVVTTSSSTNPSARFYGVNSVTSTSFATLNTSTTYMSGFYWEAKGY